MQLSKALSINAGGRRFTPASLANLAAWYDVGDASSLVYDGSNRVSLIADKSGNSATNCLCLNGTNSTGDASTPSAAANRFTGDITIVARIHSSLSGTQIIASKDNGSSVRCYQLYLSGSTPNLFWTADGTTAINRSATTGLSYSAYQKFWIKVELDVDNGAGGHTTRFFHAADTANNTEPTSWTQLGSDVSSVGVTSVFDSATQRLAIGARQQAGNGVLNGCVFYASLRGNIGGAVSQYFDPSSTSKLSSTVVNGDTTWSIWSSGDLGARISGERDLVQLTASKQPIYLPWSGTNYGWLNGVSGNYFSTPDSAALDVTGNIEFIGRVRLNDWTPSGDQVICAKRTAGQWSYQFAVALGGKFRIALTTDGSTPIVVDSSVVNSLTDGVAYWVRMTRNSSTGSCEFFFAADQSSVPSSWTQLGTAVAGTSGSIWAGTAALEVGSQLSGTNAVISGSIFRAQVLNGIGGTVVADFNPALYTSGTTFTASTGEVWTLNGGATVVNRTSVYFDGSDDYMKAAAFSLSQPETVYFTGQQVGWTDGEAIYDGNADNSMALVQTSSGGGASPRVAINNGATFVGAIDTWARGATAVISSVFNGASSGNRLNRTTAVTGNVGTTAGNGFTLGRTGVFAAQSNIRFNEGCIYSAAHDTATQDTVVVYGGSKWAISV